MYYYLLRVGYAISMVCDALCEPFGAKCLFGQLDLYYDKTDMP